IVIPNSEGDRTTPAVVAFTEIGELLIGRKAERQALTNPTDTFYSIMRLVGRSYSEITSERALLPFFVIEGWHDSVRILSPRTGKVYAAQELLALMLQKLRLDAEEYLGEPVTQAEVTVPTNFTSSQRQAIKDVAKIAGLEVLLMIGTSTAAALAYG